MTLWHDSSQRNREIMKKISLLFCTALSFVSTCALAQGDTRFREHEWELSPFLTYVDKAGDQWGLGTSLTYFLTDRIGVGAATFWTGTGGTFIDNLAGEAYFRLPIFEALAPYAVGSFGYQFDSSEWFETLGGGLDFRLGELGGRIRL